jgi:hypothetical protein
LVVKSAVAHFQINVPLVLQMVQLLSSFMESR